MASASLSAVAGAILSPRLPQIALDKLITYLWDYLSTDHPSSSSEAAKLKQWEALEDANQKLKKMQSEAKRLLKKDNQNVTVIRLLKKLNEVGYEIQDLESDMEYMELQRKVEEINQAEADTSQSRGKKRWFSFPWAKDQSNEKRRRLSSSESLKLPLDNMVDRISSLIKQINSIDSEMITQIKVDEWFKEIKLNGVYDPWAKKNERVTSSYTNERKIYGRGNETTNLIKVLMECSNGNISVVPIRGMGGMGKTTLAQFVFNNPEIENYFDEKVWVYVSNHFDRLRITKEIVESLSTYATPMFPYGTTNLNLLETELKRRLTRKKKFLLVLDDVWSDEWQQLLAPLKLTKVESIKIIVTSRDRTPLAGLKNSYRDEICLQRLYGDDYKSFFIDCVFGNDDPDNYSLALQSIGEQIMEKLKGSPLAVKTVGRLLGRNLTEEHWKHVLDSDLWEIGSDANDIMPALALTFHHLPEHLQLCFSFCSVFPKGHRINRCELIGMWIAHGYILESGTNSKTLEDIGEEYLKELEQLSLIGYSAKMHDLLHDLAISVSQGEVCIYEGKRDKRISTKVRHLCVRGPVDLGSVVRISNSLRTLVLFGDDICSQVDLEALKRIRVLVVIDKSMQEFPEAVTHLKHLRYLDFSRSSIKCVPESLCRLYQLRVLRLPKLDALPSLFHSLINLRNLSYNFVNDEFVETVYIISSSHLWENRYQVTREGGFRIAQLGNMNQLTGNHQISGLQNIENKEEARKANLKEKRLIKLLRLCWEDSVGAGCTHGVQEEVFEGLQPHPNLKHLWIRGYMGSKSPSWLGTTPAALQMLRSIKLENCRNWLRLPPSIGMLPSLVDLSLNGMENITIEGDDTVTMIFPSLEKLELKQLASISFEGMSLSSSSTTQPGGRKLFPLLKKLRVYKCDVVNGLPWPMFSHLSELYILYSRGLDAQLPGCLKGLKSLTWLEISRSKCETLFDSREVMATLERLNHVTVEHCNELISVDGLQVLPSLTLLEIRHCQKLRWLWVEGEGTSEQQQQQQQQGVKVLLPKLYELYIRNCEDLESLPSWLPLLPSLKSLMITDCPKVRSLPEGGLPTSLRYILRRGMKKPIFLPRICEKLYPIRLLPEEFSLDECKCSWSW